MYAGKPIIGIAGGIGSGKSFIADLFGEFGGLVIKSDEQVHEAYRSPEVLTTLRQWWGDAVFKPDGSLDRRAVGRIVFADPAERERLEAFIHPMVNAARDRLMQQRGGDPAVRAFIWDIPLLFETGLNARCDCVVFVEAPQEVRRARVSQSRGWTSEELQKRENLQIPLDRKRQISDYVLSNVGPADVVREQARDVFSRILAKLQPQ